MTPTITHTLGALAVAGAFAATDFSAAKPVESVAHVATLHSARAAHTATTLSSGHVLIVGGMTTGGAALPTVELFDPSTNAVTQVASLAQPRLDHTATLLPDGRVLVTGGYNGEYLRSVEVFDPAGKRFSAAGLLLEGRSGHTATLMPNGRILITGGVGRGWTFLRSAEVFDPATGRSESVGALSVPRESHTATLLADGRVAIIGGHAGRRQNMEVHASMETFSPQTGRFEAVGTLGTPRHKHDAIRLADGRVLVIGGADRSDRVHFATTEIYDPRTDAIGPGPEMASRRYKIAGTSVRLPGGQVLITSGARAAELFDPATGTFRQVRGQFPAAYRFAAAALLRDGDVVIMGGYSDTNENTAELWRFRRVSPR